MTAYHDEHENEYDLRAAQAKADPMTDTAIGREWPTSHSTFAPGDRVEKTKGSSWHGTVCGWYRTELTPEGYCVESEREPGSVQIYPVAALSGASKPSEPVHDGWFVLEGDARLGECATDGCGGQPTWRHEAYGVGANYCAGCRAKIMRSEASK